MYQGHQLLLLTKHLPGYGRRPHIADTFHAEVMHGSIPMLYTQSSSLPADWVSTDWQSTDWVSTGWQAVLPCIAHGGRGALQDHAPIKAWYLVCYESESRSYHHSATGWPVLSAHAHTAHDVGDAQLPGTLESYMQLLSFSS
jgi:hypothetical protein